MAHTFKTLTALAMLAAMTLPVPALARDHGGGREDGGRHEGWRGGDRGYERDRGGWRGERGYEGYRGYSGYREPYREAPRRGYGAPLIGGALLGLGLGAVLGGAVHPGPSYAPGPAYAPGYAPAPHYAPPPPAYYAPDKPPTGYYGY